ncbi:hypothetical protein C7R94_15230 [Brevibacillus sp. NRRL NRS-603]|nr:hypothetical protein C7R94_15230 [Brevibacillus sp. NRRL NRS-603]
MTRASSSLADRTNPGNNQEEMETSVCVFLNKQSLFRQGLFFLPTAKHCRIEREKGGKGDSSALFFPTFGSLLMNRI